MTIVHNLCLNHRQNFPVGPWVADDWGNEQIEICRAADHRGFFFYGGIQSPFPFVWVYPNSQINHLEQNIREEKTCYIKTHEQAELFYSAWKKVISAGWQPEFFFSVPRFWGSDELDDKKKKYLELNPTRSSLELIINSLILREDPYSEKNEYHQQLSSAEQRTNSLLELQIQLDYSESLFLSNILPLWQSSLLEQKWLVIKALSYFYSSHKLSDLQKVYPILAECLQNEYFLLRNEGFIFISTLIQSNPAVYMEFITILLHENDKNLIGFGLKSIIFIPYEKNEIMGKENWQIFTQVREKASIFNLNLIQLNLIDHGVRPKDIQEILRPNYPFSKDYIENDLIKLIRSIRNIFTNMKNVYKNIEIN